MPDDHPYRKTPSVAALRRQRAADEVAHAAEETTRKAALSIVERWNWERSVLWSPTVRCAITAGTPWLDVQLPRVPDKQGDRHPHTGPSPARVGRRPRNRPAVLVVSRRQRTYAGAHRASCGVADRAME